LNWNSKIFRDCDLSGDPETRNSVMGFNAYLLDIPISWSYKAHRSVTLSNTEAEHIAISQAAKEIELIYYLLKDFHIEVIL
jgi:hypothetical protein